MKLKSQTVKCTQKIRKGNFKQSEIKTDTVTPSLNKLTVFTDNVYTIY